MTVITRSVASLSWIDPKSGLPEVDSGGNPGSQIPRAKIVGLKAYRFSNLLEAVVETDEQKKITAKRFTHASGMYRGPSFMRIPSAAVGKIGRQIEATDTSVTFRQVVGCRTMSPEMLGLAGGAAIGSVAGRVVGTTAGPFGKAVVSAGGYLVGGVIGKEVAEYIKAFPPIWTELELTIRVDGSTSLRLISNSLFPSCTLYRETASGNAIYDIVSNYDAVPALARWNENGWGDAPADRSGPVSGNPWNMVSGRRKFGGHKVNRPCPTGYTCD